MQEFLKELLLAVVIAATPVCATVCASFIGTISGRLSAYIKEKTDSEMIGKYLTEVYEAIAAAVAATNQTYVDSLKNAGKFDAAAQREAAQKALETCLASISPAAKAFIEAAYDDIRKYLTTRIEAEVRKQKNEVTALLPTR